VARLRAVELSTRVASRRSIEFSPLALRMHSMAPVSSEIDRSGARTDLVKAPSKQAWWRSTLALLKQTGSDWVDDEAPRLAASLALYTLLSIAPLLVIAVAVAGMAFGADAARGQIGSEISKVVGPQAGQAIEAMVANARAPESGIISTVLGVVVLLFGASGVFGELQSALNRIWEVKPNPGRGVWGFVRDRFWSFSMVMGVAFLLLVSLVVSAAVVAVTHRLGELIPLPALWQLLNIIIGIGVTTVLFALTFKIVPDVKIAWREVWLGGLVTALLFSAGRVALSWYVGRSATVSPFGAAGSLVALIIWVYYSAQILFLGAEFTQAHAVSRGLRPEPTANAVPIDTPEPSETANRDPKDQQAVMALSEAASAAPPSQQPGKATLIGDPRRQSGTFRPDESVPRLLRQALANAKDLARLEIKLAQEELAHDVKRAKTSAIVWSIGLVLAIVLLCMLGYTLILVLGGTAWVAVLVALGFLAIAAVLGGLGFAQLPKPLLKRTRQRLDDDVNALGA
jgi:membrane protein